MTQGIQRADLSMNDQAIATTTMICLGLCAGAVAVLRALEWLNYQAKKV